MDPIRASRAAWRAAWQHKICFYPTAAASRCGKIVDSHTIQRSLVLGELIDETNHVSSFYPPEEFEGVLKIHRVGWRKASTVSGFCAKHDDLIFEPIEKKAFVGSPEQCFLIGYRALCHEVFQKTAALKSMHIMRRSLDPQIWAVHEAGTQRGLKDFQKLKSLMDEQLLSTDFSGWSQAIVPFSGPLCMVSTGAVSPNRDVDGNDLQTLHDPSTDLESLLAGMTRTNNGGAVILVWRESDTAPRRFVDSILRRGVAPLGGLLVQFTFAYIENTFFAQRWDSLSPADASHLQLLAGTANAYYTDFSYSSSQFVPWKIDSLTLEVGSHG
jgi:hypothetical protein